MSRKVTYLALGVAVIAATIAGYVITNGPDPDQRVERASTPLNTTLGTPPVSLQKVEAPTHPPKVLAHPLQPVSLPKFGREMAVHVGATEQNYATPKPGNDQLYSPLGFACDVTLQANKVAGAMVLLDFNAPCHMGEAVTVRHDGLIFTAVTSGLGRFRVAIPAMVKRAEFNVEISGGDVVTATALVPEADDFDRVAVQWVGDSGLGIHAIEPGGAHVRAGSSQNALVAVQSRGGFITTLGDANLPEAKHIEVYSYPGRRMQDSGVVRLRLVAKVTAQNCGQDIQARILQSGVNGGVSPVDLTLNIPACDAIGSDLVLNNLLRDLKIAQN